jgi:hypothetical protein
VFKVVDVDKPGTPLAPGGSQEIGKVETTMSKIVGAPKGRFESPLFGKGGKDGFGNLIVIAEQMKGRDNDTLHMAMKGVSLAAKDGFLSGGKSGERHGGYSGAALTPP